MVRFRDRPAPHPDSCIYSEATDRIRAELDAARLAHGENAMVSVRQVLDLLNPRGGWRYTDRREDTSAPGLEQGVDPLTGCKPVTAQPQ